MNPYPVGSIYLSVNSTSPATLFGGTWEQIKDTFLLACGDTYAAESKGGEAEHVLTQSEIPNYFIGFVPNAVPPNHGLWNNGGITAGDKTITAPQTGIGGSVEITEGTQYGWNINSNGGSKAHNNMPPYLAVYVWYRVS